LLRFGPAKCPSSQQHDDTAAKHKKLKKCCNKTFDAAKLGNQPNKNMLDAVVQLVCFEKQQKLLILDAFVVGHLH